MRSDALHRFTPSRADRSVPGATCAHRVLRRDPAAEDHSCERPVRLLSFDPRCASRYEPSRHELALVSSGRGPYMESGFAREPALAAPPIFSLSGRGSSTALSSRCHPSRAQPRLDRAHAPRGTRAAAIPVRSTDICNPQDLFFNDEPLCLGAFRIVLPTRFGSRRFYAGGPLRRSVHCFSAALRAAAFTPRHAARRASDVLSAFAASDRDEPRARIQRELRARFRRAA